MAGTDARSFRIKSAKAYGRYAVELHALATEAGEECVAAKTAARKKYWMETFSELANASEEAARAAKDALQKRMKFYRVEGIYTHPTKETT